MKRKIFTLSNIGIALIFITIAVAGIFAFSIAESTEELSDEMLAELPTANPFPMFIVTISIGFVLLIFTIYFGRCKNGKNV